MQGLNRMATELVDEAIDFADELGIRVHHLPNDAVVLDFGVEAPGGLEAGLLLAELRTGGLATVQTRVDTVAGAPLAHVELSTDHADLTLRRAAAPIAAIDEAPVVRVAGPGRLLLDGGSPDDADFAVLAVEAERLPDGELATAIAGRVGLPPSAVFLPTAPPGSPAGATASAARAGEAAVDWLAEHGADPDVVRSVTGSAPVAPLAGDATLARSIDAIAFGARVHVVVESMPAGIGDSTGDDPSTAAGDREGPETLPRPAVVTVDAVDGPTEVVGAVDEAALAGRLGLCG